MPKILHFADSHIDMANYGRQDPETGLPLRVMDFLKSLDQIVDTAIAEPADCVIFAGDAYKTGIRHRPSRESGGKGSCAFRGHRYLQSSWLGTMMFPLQ